MTPHKINVFPDGRMTPKDAAIYTGFSEGTLANWRVYGIGPKFLKKRNRIFYIHSEIDSWLQQEGMFTTTAQARLTSNL